MLEVVSIRHVPLKVRGDGTFRQSKMFFWPEDGTQPTRSRWALRGLTGEVFDALGFLPMDRPGEYKFSSKAGCSKDDCSPGFVLNVRWGYDLHVFYRTVDYEMFALRKAVAGDKAMVITNTRDVAVYG